LLRKGAFLVVFCLIIASDAFAQDQNQAKKVADKKFWTVNLLFAGSTIYNVESKFYAWSKCNECQEKNIYGFPVQKSGRPLNYAIIATTDTTIFLLSHELKKKNSKLWFIIPLSAAAIHSAAGTYNIRFGMRY